ncbi:hypothetical protein I4U23_017549 [Adineta vaga]|nr:hypothetical protein I4U23_017549 [Adineta vaga]
MAKTMSIIRYKYKADRDYESIQFEGMSCSLGELKRLIIEKSSRSGSNHTKDDYDLIISDSTTHIEYKDSSDMIARNTSVVVTRRIRGTFESLTPSSIHKPVVSSDDIVKEYLLPAMYQPTQITTSSTMVESIPVPLEMLTPPLNTTETTELTEDERIKEIVKTSRSQYLSSRRSNNSQICHNCKQPGHLRNQCPLLLQSSSTNTNGNPSSSGGRTDTMKSTFHPHHHPHHGNRAHYRGTGHVRQEPLPKKPTGIPRGGLIRIPRHIPGAFSDQAGTSVVPRQMAQLIVENSEKKADALAQRARQFQEKGVLPPAPPPSMLPTKSADEDLPSEDLLCPICKQIYNDAVITPCCHNSFCDECIRTALIESEDHECPHCHRQHVAIDQINPNLFLRKHINNWLEERQRKSSYPYISANHYLSPQTIEKDFDSSSTRSVGLINNQLSSDTDEYETMNLPTVPQQTVKTAPIVIRMQPLGRGQSPSISSPVVMTQSVDTTSEDGTTASEKDDNFQLLTVNNGIDEEISNTEMDTNISEAGKSDRQTPPSQLTPVSTILSSPPTTTTTTATPMLSHYYPTPSHHHQQQHMYHNMMYPPSILPASSTNFYPIHHNFYPPPMHLSYPGAPPILPPGGYHHYPQHPHFPVTHPHSFNATHLQPNPINGFHVTHYETANISSLHQPGTTYAATSTSTVIAHHHQDTTTQPISKSIDTILPKDEFHSKQRKRSISRHRSRSSYSSNTSNDSRHSSLSRRHRHRSSHSRNHRHEESRKISPNHREKRRSPIISKPRRRTPPLRNDYHSSKSRKLSPRSYHSTRERRRSPRPPPTVQQSTQRTIVYMHESSSSKHHHSDRNRDQSRSHRNDDPTVPSDVRPKTLASRIETVMNEKSSILSNSSNKINDETGSIHNKKRKDHYHHDYHRKHRRHDSKSEKHDYSKDNRSNTNAIINKTGSTVQVQ